MNEDDLLRQQIDAIIRDEIQEVVNDYVDEGKAGEGLKGVGFVQKEDEELKVNIPQNEIDKLIKEYKKIKKRQKKSNLHQVKKMGLVDKDGRPLD
jgi:hypothetical protein|tara:strand:+ start:49 stop:333 length:285 start_codon:yes stop_codon:yes gene_type:complete